MKTAQSPEGIPPKGPLNFLPNHGKPAISISCPIGNCAAKNDFWTNPIVREQRSTPIGVIYLQSFLTNGTFGPKKKPTNNHGRSHTNPYAMRNARRDV